MVAKLSLASHSSFRYSMTIFDSSKSFNSLYIYPQPPSNRSSNGYSGEVAVQCIPHYEKGRKLIAETDSDLSTEIVLKVLYIFNLPNLWNTLSVISPRPINFKSALCVANFSSYQIRLARPFSYHTWPFLLSCESLNTSHFNLITNSSLACSSQQILPTFHTTQKHFVLQPGPLLHVDLARDHAVQPVVPLDSNPPQLWLGYFQ